MASKRPSYVSIRARQRNVIEGIKTRGLNETQAAKEFGVTRPALRKFTGTKPQDLRKVYNRSPELRKLYSEGARPETRRVLNVPRIQRIPFHEIDIRAMQKEKKDVSAARLIQALYSPNHVKQQAWAIFVTDKNLPNSIDAIKLLWRNGKVSDDKYQSVLRVWADIYGIKIGRLIEYGYDPDWIEEAA